MAKVISKPFPHFVYMGNGKSRPQLIETKLCRVQMVMP